MENKKTRKLFKIILLIVLIVIILLSIHTIRNFIIIKEIQNNVSNYLMSTNYHIKSVATEKDGVIVTVNYYEKDNKQAMIMERNSNGEITKMSMYNNGERTNIYYDNEVEKTVQLDANITLWFKIFDCLETENNGQTFMKSLTSIIKTTEYNDKECYIVNLFMNNGGEKNEYYIDKETGLYVKANIYDQITEREYEFDNVSDEIFIEPDISQYTIQEK